MSEEDIKKAAAAKIKENEAAAGKVEAKKEDKKKGKKSDKEELASDLIHLKIYSPFKVYFDGEAKSVSAENDTGAFDILPRHHNFITLLNPGEIIVEKVDGQQVYKIARGVMHVKKNAVVIFLDV